MNYRAWRLNKIGWMFLANWIDKELASNCTKNKVYCSWNHKKTLGFLMISGGIDFIFRVFRGKLPTKIKVLIFKFDIGLNAIYCHIADWWKGVIHQPIILELKLILTLMRCVARCGTICTILKTWKTPMEEGVILLVVAG